MRLPFLFCAVLGLPLLACRGPSAAGPEGTERAHGSPTSAETPGDEGEVPSSTGSPNGSGSEAGSAGGPSSSAGSDAATPAGALETGSLAVTWQHGSADCKQNQDPPLQVFAYNKDLTILRQNKCLSYEAPFLYLLFGTTKALLLDTGATSSATTFPVRQRIEALLVEHYGAGRANVTLVAAHTHAHADHRSGDAQFSGQAGTTVVGTSQTAVAAFFGIRNWPTDIVPYDLGERVLDIVPTPGHEASHIAIYDRRTGLLFTGDTLYPGRIYVQNWAALRLSATRLATFVGSRPITAVLGAHVEMTKTPGVDYPTGATYQPDEHVLPLTKATVLELDSELQKAGASPVRRVAADFIIDP